MELCRELETSVKFDISELVFRGMILKMLCEIDGAHLCKYCFVPFDIFPYVFVYVVDNIRC
jgi:hypothetical protein